MRLVSRYAAADDEAALAAGQRLAVGCYSFEDLKVIVRWKSSRRLALLAENSESDVAVALQFAISASTPEAMAVAVLTALRGVAIPVASAILTAIKPEKFTILDFRALESLGVTNRPETVSFYVHYLNACRELAATQRVSLRDLDRALWQWSWEKSQKIGV